jgi:Protein of unknown function (DUF2515)
MKEKPYTDEEQSIIDIIKAKTIQQNMDNISRTKAYATYFEYNKEIKWAFLASMVSRNAGWNMTDLEGAWYPIVLSPDIRKTLFLTYEKANWTIFSDAFPQLLLYQFSKQLDKPLFHLLKAFSVSAFMKKEWEYFWHYKDQNRLLTALIINEQNVIQKPVIEHPFFKEKVFRSIIFRIQDWLHFSTVLFPTIRGQLFGFSVHDFQSLSARIELGKKLGWLLFHPEFFHEFYLFSQKTEHTGSRFDYEQYLFPYKRRDTPILRFTFPVIHHQRNYWEDWYNPKVNVKKWFKPIRPQRKIELTKWYLKKQKQLHIGILLEQFFRKI